MGSPITLALECAQALQTAGERLLAVLPFAQNLHDAGFLMLLFKAALEPFVGFLAFAFILYAGFLWMTAGGNEENVTKAKTMMRNAVVGFIIISAAYATVNFVITSLP